MKDTNDLDQPVTRLHGLHGLQCRLWTDEEDAVLRANWLVISAAKIGRLVGRSRNAVIGRAHRIDKSNHHKGPRPLKPVRHCVVCSVLLVRKQRTVCGRRCVGAALRGNAVTLDQPAACARCGRAFMRNRWGTGMYCGPICRKASREDYDKLPETKVRKRLCALAGEEAAERGISCHQQLIEWGADPGRASKAVKTRPAAPGTCSGNPEPHKHGMAAGEHPTQILRHVSQQQQEKPTS